MSLAPLIKLKSLTHLNLKANLVVDPVPLKGLKSLNYLHLSDNKIVDITPIKGLPALTELHLGNNKIGDIRGIEKLTTLTGLFLYNCEITDIIHLGQLRALTTLHLGYNNITDITSIKSLSNLTELYLVSISPLTKLTFLDLSDNMISELGPQEQLNNLETVRRSNNKISDISALIRNRGVGKGDTVYVIGGNSIEQRQITFLTSRGVEVNY